LEIDETDHERRLRELARKLFFTFEKHGATFSLARDIDVPNPIRYDGLTLAEAEDILNTWKLRGLHGG
jgi:hypothetical protein